LCAALPGKVWLLRTTKTRAAEVELRRHVGILGVAQIGNSLRVLAEPSMEEAGLRRLLPADAHASIEAAAPNLEDVFVAHCREPTPLA